MCGISLKVVELVVGDVSQKYCENDRDWCRIRGNGNRLRTRAGITPNIKITPISLRVKILSVT